MRGCEWGDDIAVRALCNYIARPLIIFRKGTSQVPACFVPRGFDSAQPFVPIYLSLDERLAKSEHYNAMFVSPSLCKFSSSENSLGQSDAANADKTPATGRKFEE